MDIKSILSDVVHLPREFRNRGNVSMNDLLCESGYFGAHEQVTENAIHQALLEHPGCARDWMEWSERKRTDEGWFIRREGQGWYEVGHYPVRDDMHQVVAYTHEAAACAAFIKHELEVIRTDGKVQDQGV